MLVVGDWHSDLHETELCKSLQRLGHEVAEFRWYPYFKLGAVKPWSMPGIFRRLQNKFVAGPLIARLNQDFIVEATRQDPDVIFIYRGTHIRAKTLKALQRVLPKCRFFGYNNDDPFSPSQPRYLWRHFLQSVPLYDLMLAYRHANIQDFYRAGAKNVMLMRSWFVPDRSYPINLSAADRQIFDCDVVFVGHYEPDQRLEYLEAIAARGHKVKIFGPTKYWQKPLRNSALLRHLAPTRMVWGDEYNKALCGAKIALCFFSKLNRDTYTRRCFEIPATRSLMLCEYSEDIASLYKQGVEADFFTSKQEMLDLIDHYLGDESARARVAEAGFAKVYSAGHDIDSRISTLLKEIQG